MILLRKQLVENSTIHAYTTDLLTRRQGGRSSEKQTNTGTHRKELFFVYTLRRCPLNDIKIQITPRPFSYQTIMRCGMIGVVRPRSDPGPGKLSKLTVLHFVLFKQSFSILLSYWKKTNVNTHSETENKVVIGCGKIKGQQLSTSSSRTKMSSEKRFGSCFACSARFLRPTIGQKTSIQENMMIHSPFASRH